MEGHNGSDHKAIHSAIVRDIAAVFDRPSAEAAKGLAGDSESRQAYLRSLARAVKRDEDVFVGTTTAARLLGCSAKTVRRWADKGLLAFTRRFGGSRMFSMAELKRQKQALDGKL